MSNLLGVPGVYHWVSQVDGTTYEDYVRGVQVCKGAAAVYCSVPSERDCEAEEMDFSSPEPTVDEKEPIIPNEKRWVVLHREDNSKVYVELTKYIKYMSAGCENVKYLV